MGWVEKLLALWVILCIIIGLLLGKYFPEFSEHLEIGIPIGLFLMIYPAMTKIELGELKDSLKSKKQVGIKIPGTGDKRAKDGLFLKGELK